MALIGLLALRSAAPVELAAQAQPNILMIVADGALALAWQPAQIGRVAPALLRSFRVWLVLQRPRMSSHACVRTMQSDFGYNDVGYHQSTPTTPKPHPANPHGEATTDDAAGVMPTPTLDQLASEGTKLEMYYVQPLCSPTRATSLTLYLDSTAR